MKKQTPLELKGWKKDFFNALISVFFCYMIVFWIYSNGLWYIDNQVAPVPLWPPPLSIIPEITLNGEHHPEYPQIGEIVLFKGKICNSGYCKPCENCTVEIMRDVDYTDKLIRTGIPLNDSGEIQFQYQSTPTWIKMTGYNATLFYRVSKPDFAEQVSILFNKWPLSFGMQIASLLGGITAIISLIFIGRGTYRFLKEKAGKKKDQLSIAS